MACPNCHTVRTPDDDIEQVLVTVKALVHNFQTLAILLDSVSSAGQTEILDSLRTSFSSYLPRVGGAQQLPQELVQNTIRALDQFHMLSPRPPKSLATSETRAAVIDGENCEQSRHPWSPSEEIISTEFCYLTGMHAPELLKGLKSGNNRHKERDKFTPIAQIKNLVSCEDPSGGVEEMARQENLAVGRTKPIPPDTLGAPVPPKTPHVPPRQGIEQLGAKEHGAVPLHEHNRPLGPSLPPNPIASRYLQACWRPEGAVAPGASGTSNPLTMTGEVQTPGGSTTEVIPKDAEPGQQHSGLIFKNWAATNILSFVDLFKPVILDYFPIRDIPREDSSVRIASGATPLTLTTFWRNLCLPVASEIFQWMNVYRGAAMDIANSYKKRVVSHDHIVRPQHDRWIPLLYPRDRFIGDMHAKFKQMYGESSWSGEEILRLLNTCGTCRSLATDPLSKPSYMLDKDRKQLLHFSIRFDGASVVFQDLLRQILVPPIQAHTSRGETLTITPVLYDPHHLFADLSTKTSFEVPSQFSWLRWDQVLQGFIGTVPESLLAVAQTRPISQAQKVCIVDIPITAKTVTPFLAGVQYETRVRAQVKLRISKDPSLGNIHPLEGQIAKTLSTTGLVSEPIGPDTTPDRTEYAKKPPLEPEHERCVGDKLYSAPAVSEAQAAEDQANPGESDISVFLWGQGFKEWMNIVFLAGPHARSAQHHRVSNNESSPLRFTNLNLSARGSWSCPWMDSVENQIFRIGAELAILANYGTHSRLHRDICNNLEASTGAIGLFHESYTEFIPSFTALGPIDTLDGKAIGKIDGIQPSDILPRSSTSWVRAILQKLIKQLACFRYDFNETIKISIHVGMEAVPGYDLREIKTIAKAIVLFGGLFNGVGLGPNPNHHKCCPDLTERVRSNVTHIQAIDKASSIEDVAQLMSSLEASGYTYHSEPGIENQRYDFSCLESQGVIIWIQTFPKFNGMDVIDWISMILFFSRRAISTGSSLFADLAEKPITLASLNRFIAKG